jgi:hypothetical protein
MGTPVRQDDRTLVIELEIIGSEVATGYAIKVGPDEATPQAVQDTAEI